MNLFIHSVASSHRHEIFCICLQKLYRLSTIVYITTTKFGKFGWNHNFVSVTISKKGTLHIRKTFFLWNLNPYIRYYIILISDIPHNAKNYFCNNNFQLYKNRNSLYKLLLKKIERGILWIVRPTFCCSLFGIQLMCEKLVLTFVNMSIYDISLWVDISVRKLVAKTI